MTEGQDQRYIGDGVYVSYDGYHICIAVNHHLNHAVSLEPEVFMRLLKYASEKFEAEQAFEDGIKEAQERMSQ